MKFFCQFLTPFCAFVAAALALTMSGQTPGDRYEALKQALGLSDAQVLRLQEMPPRAITRTPSPGNSTPVQIYPGPFARGMNLRAQNEEDLRVLDDSQRDKLAAIQRVLGRRDAADVTIGLGLINMQQWPGTLPCFVFYQIASYASFAYASELGLTPYQMERFEEIQRAADEPLLTREWAMMKQRSEFLGSGVSEDSPAVVELGSEIEKLAAQVNARPRHDLALAVLDDTQRAKLADLESTLQIASEAIELGLIPKPGVGEILCH